MKKMRVKAEFVQEFAMREAMRKIYSASQAAYRARLLKCAGDFTNNSMLLGDATDLAGHAATNVRLELEAKFLEEEK